MAIKKNQRPLTQTWRGQKVSITYTYKGDKIIKQTSESKISYATVGAKTKEDAAKILDPLSAKYKNIAGVEEKLTYEDTYAQENVSVDMEKVDFKALQQISGTMVSGDTSKGISMKQTQTLLEAAGFKEAK